MPRVLRSRIVPGPEEEQEGEGRESRHQQERRVRKPETKATARRKKKAPIRASAAVKRTKSGRTEEVAAAAEGEGAVEMMGTADAADEEIETPRDASFDDRVPSRTASANLTTLAEDSDDDDSLEEFRDPKEVVESLKAQKKMRLEERKKKESEKKVAGQANGSVSATAERRQPSREPSVSILSETDDDPNVPGPSRRGRRSPTKRRNIKRKVLNQLSTTPPALAAKRKAGKKATPKARKARARSPSPEIDIIDLVDSPLPGSSPAPPSRSEASRTSATPRSRSQSRNRPTIPISADVSPAVVSAPSPVAATSAEPAEPSAYGQAVMLDFFEQMDADMSSQQSGSANSGKGGGRQAVGEELARSPQEGTKEAVTCPVCMDNLAAILSDGRKLRSTTCGHVFCNTCIEALFKNHKNIDCPQCRKKITKSQVNPLFL